MRGSTNLWLAQTSTPSVHEDITQIATLQVIKQCHKWDKRGRRDDDADRVSRTAFTIFRYGKGSTNFQNCSPQMGKNWLRSLACPDLRWNSVFLRAKAKRSGKREGSQSMFVTSIWISWVTFAHTEKFDRKGCWLCPLVSKSLVYYPMYRIIISFLLFSSHQTPQFHTVL